MCSTVDGETPANGTTNIQKVPMPNSLVDLAGEWGPWQRRTVLLIFLCKIPAAWFMACVIFTAPLAKHGEYQCKQSPSITGHAIFDSAGASAAIVHPITANGDIDVCHVYKNSTSIFAADNRQTTESCNAFEHHSIFDSLVTQFDLVCSRTILIAVTQFFHLCGVLTGGILATQLLD